MIKHAKLLTQLLLNVNSQVKDKQHKITFLYLNIYAFNKI